MPTKVCLFICLLASNYLYILNIKILGSTFYYTCRLLQQRMLSPDLRPQNRHSHSMHIRVFQKNTFLPTPLTGGQEISFAPGMIFLAPVSIFNVLPQGGSFDYPPEGAITHFWGILDSVSNFECATPRWLLISNHLHTPSLLNTWLYLIVCTSSFCMTAQSFSYGNTEQECMNINQF